MKDWRFFFSDIRIQRLTSVELSESNQELTVENKLLTLQVWTSTCTGLPTVWAGRRRRRKRRNKRSRSGSVDLLSLQLLCCKKKNHCGSTQSKSTHHYMALRDMDPFPRSDFQMYFKWETLTAIVRTERREKHAGTRLNSFSAAGAGGLDAARVLERRQPADGRFRPADLHAA